MVGFDFEVWEGGGERGADVACIFANNSNKCLCRHLKFKNFRSAHISYSQDFQCLLLNSSP